eukprot:11628_5
MGGAVMAVAGVAITSTLFKMSLTILIARVRRRCDLTSTDKLLAAARFTLVSNPKDAYCVWCSSMPAAISERIVIACANRKRFKLGMVTSTTSAPRLLSTSLHSSTMSFVACRKGVNIPILSPARFL